MNFLCPLRQNRGAVVGVDHTDQTLYLMAITAPCFFRVAVADVWQRPLPDTFEVDGFPMGNRPMGRIRCRWVNACAWVSLLIGAWLSHHRGAC